jgi:hypothetical protein
MTLGGDVENQVDLEANHQVRVQACSLTQPRIVLRVHPRLAVRLLIVHNALLRP